MASYDKNIKINLDYSTFTGGISQCQAKIKTLNEAMKLSNATMTESGDTSEALAEKEQILTAKIELQQKILEQTIAKYQALTEDSTATGAALERMEQNVLKQETALQGMQNELAGVVREEEALRGSTDATGTEMDEAGESTEGFASHLTNAISTLSAFSAAASAVAGEVEKLATGTSQWADDLLTQSQVTGLSVETLQELSYAENLIDVSQQTMTSSMTRMIREMASAADGSESAKAKFADLGLSITDSAGNLKPAEQMFGEVIDALGGMSNEAERDAAAMDIFGKSAQQLNPLIEAGTERLEELKQEAHATGNVLTEEQVEAFQKTQDEIDKMNIEMNTATVLLGGMMQPAVTELAKAFQALPQPVQMGIAATKSLLNIGSSLVPVMTMLNTHTIAAAASNGALATAEGAKAAADTVATGTTWAFNAALAVQIAEIALAVAAVVALAYIIYSIVKAFDDEASAADRAASSIGNYASAMASVGSNSISKSISGNSAPHRALGGKIFPHAAAGYESVWVGEQGAELVDLPYGSTVYNHEDSRNMANTTNYFNVTIDAKSVDEISKVVKVFNGLSQSMNRGGRLNR